MSVTIAGHEKIREALSKRSTQKADMQRALEALNDAELVEAWGLEKLTRRRKRIFKMIYEIRVRRGVPEEEAEDPEV